MTRGSRTNANKATEAAAAAAAKPADTKKAKAAAKPADTKKAKAAAKPADTKKAAAAAKLAETKKATGEDDFREDATKEKENVTTLMTNERKPQPLITKQRKPDPCPNLKNHHYLMVFKIFEENPKWFEGTKKGKVGTQAKTRIYWWEQILTRFKKALAETCTKDFDALTAKSLQARWNTRKEKYFAALKMERESGGQRKKEGEEGDALKNMQNETCPDFEQWDRWYRQNKAVNLDNCHFGPYPDDIGAANKSTVHSSSDDDGDESLFDQEHTIAEINRKRHFDEIETKAIRLDTPEELHEDLTSRDNATLLKYREQEGQEYDAEWLQNMREGLRTILKTPKGSNTGQKKPKPSNNKRETGARNLSHLNKLSPDDDDRGSIFESMSAISAQKAAVKQEHMQAQLELARLSMEERRQERLAEMEERREERKAAEEARREERKAAEEARRQERLAAEEARRKEMEERREERKAAEEARRQDFKSLQDLVIAMLGAKKE